MRKQDRQGARTPAALERKYDFGQRFDNQDQKNKDQHTETAALAAGLEAHIQNSNKALSRIAQDLTQLGTALSSLEGRHAALQEDMEQSFGVVNETVSCLIAAVTALQQTAAALSSASAQQAAQIARAETMLSFHDGRLHEIDAALEALGTQ